MNIIQQLIRDEGERLKPYTDTVGKITIGVGRNLTDNGIRETEAMMMLQNDVTSAVNDLYQALPWSKDLTDPRRGVLVNMCFNMGIHSLLQFHNTLAAIQCGDFETAASEMLQSKWAQQVGARAERLAQQMRTNQWT